MSSVINGQFTARIEGDFVVFLTGMRINKPLKLQTWWPVFVGMPRMIKELKAAGPSLGFLGHTPLRLGLMAQYWRSFEQLEAYARSRDNLHWPAWVAFNRRIKGSRGNVGIWHETYVIRAGDYECVYSGMPPYGCPPRRSWFLWGGSERGSRRSRSVGGAARLAWTENPARQSGILSRESLTG